MEKKIYIDNIVLADSKYEYFIEKLEPLEMEEVHVLSKPLLIKDEVICNGAGVALLKKGKKIIFLQNPNSNTEDFEDFVFDFKQLVSELVGKYEYRNLLGKPSKIFSNTVTFVERQSDNLLELVNDNDLDLSGDDLQYAEIMSSLIKGSINDQKRIENLLNSKDFISKAKNRIISFDTNQTRFIFPPNSLQPQNKKEVVQGMAGSGKTEMLLHRLRTIYLETMDKENVKIAFTCHNKVLANELRNNKINDFFDSMKFDKQILWDEKLYCFSAWGSQYRKISGMYSYICNHYNLNFYNYNTIGSFKLACETALAELEGREIEPIFDYVLIDESQDLPDAFFELCNLVTLNKVYIAGDVYQDIFDTNSDTSLNPDYLLNRVYRTESKTFLFAHLFALGYFDKKIKWLERSDLNLCGYSCVETSDTMTISRPALTWKTEEVEDEINPYECIIDSENANINKIIDEIISLKQKYGTELVASDIAIVVISKFNKFQNYASKLSRLITEKLEYKTSISSDSYHLDDTTVYISNQNQVKGLEFPFVFVLYDETDKQFGTKNYIKSRTAFYMAATRSLIKSYLHIVDDGKYNEVLNYSNKIISEGKVDISIPTEKEKEELKQVYDSINYTSQSVPTRDTVETCVRKYLSTYEFKNDVDIEEVISTVFKAVKNRENIDLDEEFNKLIEEKTKAVIELLYD